MNGMRSNQRGIECTLSRWIYDVNVWLSMITWLHKLPLWCRFFSKAGGSGWASISDGQGWLSASLPPIWLKPSHSSLGINVLWHDSLPESQGDFYLYFEQYQNSSIRPKLYQWTKFQTCIFTSWNLLEGCTGFTANYHTKVSIPLCANF